jgi:hypothetical protein
MKADSLSFNFFTANKIQLISAKWELRNARKTLRIFVQIYVHPPCMFAVCSLALVMYVSLHKIDRVATKR